jgi:hypothetical protein
MEKHRLLKRLAGLLLIVLLAACAATVRNDAYTETLYQYQSMIRWGHFQDASAMVDPKYLELKPISRLDWERFQQIQISSYNPSPAVPVSETEVQVTVEIEYVNIHRQTPRTIIDRQIWRFDEEAKRWWLTTGLPDLSQGR